MIGKKMNAIQCYYMLHSDKTKIHCSYREHLGKLHYLWDWGAGGSGFPYNSRESPYLRKRFSICPFISPKDSERIDDLKFFTPPLGPI